jgi:hypothetical protein
MSGRMYDLLDPFVLAFVGVFDRDVLSMSRWVSPPIGSVCWNMQ